MRARPLIPPCQSLDEIRKVDLDLPCVRGKAICEQRVSACQSKRCPAPFVLPYDDLGSTRELEAERESQAPVFHVLLEHIEKEWVCLWKKFLARAREFHRITNQINHTTSRSM
jgi:hypothetical protein